MPIIQSSTLIPCVFQGLFHRTGFFAPGPKEFLKHKGVDLSVGTFANNQALDIEVSERFDPVIVAKVGILEVEVLELADRAVMAPGDMDVGVPESSPAEFLFDLGEDPGKFLIGVEPPFPRVEMGEVQAGL
jgi:hypothetical protein